MIYKSNGSQPGDPGWDDEVREAVNRLVALRSSQSTSDAGGGVRKALDALAAIETQMQEMRSLKGWRMNLIRAHLEDARKALSNPAAADSNASAEARLREALEEDHCVGYTSI